MPGLYGTTSSYVVYSTQTTGLYVSSSTSVSSATIVPSDVSSLYAGYTIPGFSTVQAALNLFTNDGTVWFGLDPATNNTTIHAFTTGTALTTLQDYVFSTNTITLNDGLDSILNVGSQTWQFNLDGTTSFPGYTFPAADGGGYQLLQTDGNGNLFWGENVYGTTATIQLFTTDGINSNFNLSETPLGPEYIEVIVGGVFQTPVDSYSLVGNQIQFVSPPPAGTDFIQVRYLDTLNAHAYTGYTGSRGVIGYTGSQGQQGVQGPAGGYTGSMGYTGSAGAGFPALFTTSTFNLTVGSTQTVIVNYNLSLTGYNSGSIINVANATGDIAVCVIAGYGGVNNTYLSIIPEVIISSSGTHASPWYINLTGYPGSATAVGYTGSKGPAGGYTGSRGATGYVGSAGGTWAVLGGKIGPSGPSSIGLGQNAGGATTYGAVAIGLLAGQTLQGIKAVAIGSQAGNTNQGLNAVAIGDGAGQISQSTSSIAIGLFAGGNNQRYRSVAIGESAGYLSQGQGAVAVGAGAGQFTQTNYAVAIGQSAGENGQGASSISIGPGAGFDHQGIDSVAIGGDAGSYFQTDGSVAIGANAGQYNQIEAVAVGNAAGQYYQGTQAVAIGYLAGNYYQAAYSIAIGTETDTTGTNSIAIGYRAIAATSSTVILNATGDLFTSTQANSFFVKPIRHIVNGSLPSGFYNMAYNPTTGEIIYWS